VLGENAIRDNRAVDAGTIESQTVLSVDNVSKRFPIKSGLFGGVTAWFDAVADVSIELDEGKTIGIVGESGSGKTTLGKCIAALLAPSSGTIRYRGRELRPDRIDITTRLSVQMVHQATGLALDPRFKVREAIGEGLRQMSGISRAQLRQRVDAAMEAVGLRPSDAGRYPHMFSGGQKQRIVIARAIVLNPSLLILDEPTSALDVSIQVKILSLLKNLQESLGLTYVLISHDFRSVEAMADDIAVMYHGRVVERGPAAEIIAHPVHPYTKRLIKSVPVADPSRLMIDDDDRLLAAELEADLTQGCAFHPRCELAEDECRVTRPPLVELEPGHFVACPPSQRTQA
jgi:oligopeptide/dipeptide ABC transporter ATP-binding protein